MNFQDILDKILFSHGDLTYTVGQLISILLLLIVLFMVYRFLFKRFLPKYFEGKDVDEVQKNKILRITRNIIYLIAVIGLIINLGFDIGLYSTENFTIKFTTILQAILIFQVARLSDWIISKVMLHNYYQNRNRQKEEAEFQQIPEAEESEQKANRMVQYIVYAVSILFIIRAFNVNYTLFSFTAGDLPHEFKISNIVVAVIILLVARLVAWILTQLVLYRYYVNRKINVGSQYAINQLLKYVIYVIAALWAIDHLGVQMTVLWGGAAALLVGIGLGLQQTFNDLISGIILLFERSVEVGDVIEVNGLVGSVKKIGLRTSLVETRDYITVVVPNSKLIVDNVINWSHYDSKARFHIAIGVAYGSDTAKVKKLLLEVARENIYVLKRPGPFIRFKNFGDSSLDFELHFWTRNFIVIEDIKSDMRFEIDRLFRENEVEIPFPQRDVWSRTK